MGDVSEVRAGTRINLEILEGYRNLLSAGGRGRDVRISAKSFLRTGVPI